MARTRTTFGPGNPHARRGTGAGHGGTANGAGKPPGNKEAGRRDKEGNFVPTGGGKVTVADLMAEQDARRIAADAWLAILRDPTHPKHADMIARAADRMDGQPVQPVRGDGDNPGFVINVVKRGVD